MAGSRKIRWPWLVAAALLFAAGAWLMAGGEEEKSRREKKVSLPRSMTSSERKRNAGRQTMPVVAAPIVEGAPPAQLIRDPLLAAMPTEIRNGAVVIEANAIRNSDLGNLLVECVFTGETEVLAKVQDAGFDPLQSLDRVAVIDGAVMLTGDFSKTDFPGLLSLGPRKQFGSNTELFDSLRPDGGIAQQLGLWKNQVLVMANSAEEITAVIDRLDGKTDPAAPRVLTDADAYGEIYGVFKPAPFVRLLAADNPALSQLINDAASSIKLHADVSHDLGVVAQIEGSDPGKTQDLRKALGTALTLAKLQAEAQGDQNAAEVLGFARVAQAKGDSANFHLEAGLPYEFLQTQLKKCVEEKQKKLAQKVPAPQ